MRGVVPQIYYRYFCKVNKKNYDKDKVFCICLLAQEIQ